MVRILAVTLLLVLMNVCPALAGDMGPNIRVGLVVNQFSAQFSSQGEVKAEVDGGSTIKVKAGTHFVSVKKDSLYIDNKKLNGRRVSLRAGNAKFPVSINKKTYRGAIIASLDSGRKRLNVINVLPVENYLYGVVAKEVIPLWPDEAVKAQAVAARSFAMYEINNNKNQVYDVRSNEMGQVYGGIAAEHTNTNKMVDTTRGVVATYDGDPIQAFFHSCSGGYTESAVNVWGKAVPYLQAVVDYDKDSPNYDWNKSFTREDLQKALEQSGYKVGVLEGIRLSPRKKAPMGWSSDRGTSGRVKKITFKGKAGIVTLEGTKLRSILNLPSTLFDINVGFNRPDHIDVPILNSYGMQVGEKKIDIKPDKRNRNSNTVGDFHYLSSVKGEKVHFIGNGWGHGLGMSQWGARGMSLMPGAKKKDDYYKTILKHYYTGTKIKRIY
ncbi:MAG: SpoIID/LytB domain-containing protein [Acidaminococcaceae bacterium]|jgi:stage II sporulation protein D|nr:SpoIID/LytB domain-containing protein [Acidaminococcaceae bacterium]